MGVDREATIKKLLTVPIELAEEVEQFRTQTRMASGSECWRHLLRKGLQAMREEQEMLRLLKERQRIAA